MKPGFCISVQHIAVSGESRGLDNRLLSRHKQTMRIGFLILLNLVLMTGTLLADEKLAVLHVGSQTYSNVLVTTVTATDIYFTSDQGMGNAKLKNLDPELQKHFAKPGKDAQKPKPVASIYHFRVANATNPPASSADVKVELADAIAKVKGIVNQPVTRLPAPEEGTVSTFSPGWFHEGAIRPDFNNVDVRTTQELTYATHKYVTSDLNPGVVFLGAELEFNSMTKYFYTDRSLPKKKLTTAEMLEINRLYRIIGEDEAKQSK